MASSPSGAGKLKEISPRADFQRVRQKTTGQFGTILSTGFQAVEIQSEHRACFVADYSQDNSRVLNFWKPTAFILTLALLTGCAIPPKQAQRVTPLLVEAEAESPGPVEPQEPEMAPQTNLPPALPAESSTLTLSPPLKSAQLLPTNVVNLWIPWENWSATNGLGRPHRLLNATNLTYELRHTNGVLSISVGNPIARWNGMSLDLGFVPQLTNGQPFVHALDVMKNFEPLVATSAALLPSTNRTVVLDPGHGGENTGARCVCNRSFEKDYTLDWAFRLRPLLEGRGWKVYLTRTNDIDLTLSNRVAFAEQVKADLFLSLHFNSMNGSSPHHDHGGLETYCLTPAGMPSNLRRQFEDNPFRIYPNNAYDSENIQSRPGG